MTKCLDHAQINHKRQYLLLTSIDTIELIDRQNERYLFVKDIVASLGNLRYNYDRIHGASISLKHSFPIL